MRFENRSPGTIAYTLALSVLLALASCGDDGSAPAGIDGPSPLSFFVTSVGVGERGGNYGGLTGADEFCSNLASAAGAGSRTWRAYLSTAQENARDRIGIGPWYNAAGVMVAQNLEQLHTEGIPLSGEPVIIDENGQPVPLRQHDIVTGTLPDGTWYEGRTCLDWTSNAETEIAQVGHSDDFSPAGRDSRWNSTHESLSCSQEGLAARLGAGRIYCFAIR